MKEWVVITGASSGIGKDAARRLAAAGLKVIPGVRREEDFREWRDAGAHPVVLDLSKPEQVADAALWICELTKGAKRVHLVNNAGISVAGPLEAVPMDRWREQFEVNVLGLVRVTQALLPRIRDTQGRIVNISSISGLFAPPTSLPIAPQSMPWRLFRIRSAAS